MQLAFDFTEVHSEEIASRLRRDFGLINSVKTVEICGDFWSYASAFAL